MTHRNNSRRTNGHAGPHDRVNGSADRRAVNGHAPASTGRGGIPVHGDQAASDDASGASVANAAISATAAGTDRNACADAAPPRPNGALPKSSTNKSGESRRVGPGKGPLPPSPGEFVEEIHRRIDLFKVWQSLLRSKDTKIKQRAVERLTELRYKGTAALADEPQEIIFDLPRPKRD